jgi:hypothetical protein
MIWKSDRGSRGYHRGNLKEALIRAALELIAAKGPSGFTFAEAARSAGVSPAVPYRHFRDREELLANVARRGFELVVHPATMPSCFPTKGHNRNRNYDCGGNSRSIRTRTTSAIFSPRIAHPVFKRM